MPNYKKAYDKIENLIAEKDFAQASELLALQIEKEGEKLELLKLKGLCAINTNQAQTALESFQKAVELDSTDALSHFYIGSIHELTNNLDEAEKAYKKVIELRNEYTDAYKNLGIIYLKKKDFANAIKYGQEALKLKGDDYQIYFLLSNATMAIQEFQTAIVLAETAIKLEPKHSQLYFNIGNANMGLGNYDKALTYFLKAIELNSNNAAAQFMIGTIYQMRMELEQAYPYLQAAYKIENNPYYLSTLAFCAMKLAKFEDGIIYYGILTFLQPEKDNFKYNLATCYEALGKYSKSINIIEQLITRNPKAPNIFEKLANLYYLNNETMKAKLTYETMIKKGKVSSNIYYQYALICAQTNDTDKAVEILKKVIKLSPKDSFAHKDLGIIYMKQGLLDWAQDEFQIAYKLDNKNSTIVLEYANFLHLMQDYLAAKRLYSKAYKLMPTNREIPGLMAKNYIALNDLRKAKEFLTLALGQTPKDEYLLFELSKVYFSQKQYEQAKNTLLSTYSISQNIEVANLLGTVFIKLDEYKQAEKMFEKVKKQYPKNVNVLIELAKAQIELGEIGKAKTNIKQAYEIFPESEEVSKLASSLGIA